MKIELMKQERMGVEGKGILRSLQNDTLSLMDLLIRESLQNSLDATKKDVRKTLVNIGVCDFEVGELADKLEGLTEVLKARYSNQTQQAIYISDKNTIGLIGDARKKEGNIYNLIYTIQKNQEQAGAGGSWGLGKTSYFRVGNGIVLYYSRVKLSEGIYEERLAASLIEDSTKENRLLDNDRGIAWWGEKDKNADDSFESTYPMVDSEEIHKILEIFKIEPYNEKETGTTIIIPFIDEQKLLPKYEDEKKKLHWWETNLEDAIEIALQKWYAPRIFNTNYVGAYLAPSINGKLLTPDKFQTFFKKIHDLYVCGLGKKSNSNIDVDVIELKTRGISSDKGVAGWLSHGSYSKEDLKMTPPDNEVHPLEYFGYSDLEELEKTNAKIVAYARKPGMIVKYDINGIWSDKVVPLDEKFILSFFIPNSKGELYGKFQEPEIKNLEDYLRSTEKSDHADWEDTTLNNMKITIIGRIGRNVAKAIQGKYNEQEEDTPQSKASVLGKKIGEKLLPKHGVGGRRATPPVIGGGGGGQGLGRKHKLAIGVLSVDTNESNYLVVAFRLDIRENVLANISVNLKTGTKSYSEEQWIKDMGEEVKYPFEIKEVFIQEIDKETIDSNSDDLADDRIAIHFTSFENKSSFRIENKMDEDRLEIEGKLVIKVNDVLMQPLLEASEVK